MRRVLCLQRFYFLFILEEQLHFPRWLDRSTAQRVVRSIIIQARSHKQQESRNSLSRPTTNSFIGMSIRKIDC